MKLRGHYKFYLPIIIIIIIIIIILIIGATGTISKSFRK